MVKEVKSPTRRVGRPKVGEKKSTSIRIDHRAAFALDLLAARFKRVKINLLEEAIEEKATRDLRFGRDGEISWQDLWDPDEAIRKLRMLVTEGVNLSPEDTVLRRFVRAHLWFFFADAKTTFPRRGTAEVLFPRLGQYVDAWREANEQDISKILSGDLKAAGVPVPKHHG